MKTKLLWIMSWTLLTSVFVVQVLRSDDVERWIDDHEPRSFEEVLEWAKDVNTKEVERYRIHGSKGEFYKGILAEKKRLSAVDYPPHPFYLPNISSEGRKGISPYARVHLAQRCRKSGHWCFSFTKEKNLIVGGLTGNHFGTRIISGPYGDVDEISRERATKEFGIPNLCSVSRVFLLTPKKYD